MGSSIRGPVVFQQAYDLTIWYAEHTVRFPKGYRFTLADRIQKVLFDLLGHLQSAAFNQNRRSELQKAQGCIDYMRLWNRLAKDLKCLNQRQYAFAAEKIEEIGKQIGGWRRNNGADASPDAGVP